MMKPYRFLLFALCMLSLGIVAGCGGSDSGSSATATATPTPTPAPTPALAIMRGNYTFSLSGSNGFGNYSMAGVVVIDNAGGSCTVNGGEQDFNMQGFFDGVHYFANGASRSLIFSGSCAIGSDGRGTITVVTGPSNVSVGPGVGANGTETFGVVLVNASHALITEFDSSATASGSMDLQTLTSFPANTLSGGYAFVMQGRKYGDPSANPVVPTTPLAWGGVMNISGIQITSSGSVADENANGTINAASPLSGLVGPADQFGRIGLSVDTGFAPGVTIAAYVTDAQHLKLVEIDCALGVTGGDAIGQGGNTGTFDSNSLAGPFVFGGSSASQTEAAAGLFTASSGTLQNGVFDLNINRTPSHGTMSGSYSIASSGRGSASLSGINNLSSLVFYATGSGTPALFLSTDTHSILAGTFFPQSTGSFSASSLSGNYALSLAGYTTWSSGYTEGHATGAIVADGVGNTTGNWDVNQFGSQITQSSTLVQSTFSANANGRFTGTLSTIALQVFPALAYYAVSSSQFVTIMNDSSSAGLGLLEKQDLSTTSTGTPGGQHGGGTLGTANGLGTGSGTGRALIGYWQNFDASSVGEPDITLGSVSPNFDVIDVIAALPVPPDTATITFSVYPVETQTQFINDIAYLHGQGKKVMLTLGGGTAFVQLNTSTDVTNFVNSVSSLITQYGFDGIDIDFENDSVTLDAGDTDITNPTSPDIVNLISALHTLKTNFGANFLISFVPETQYVQAGISAYGGLYGSYLPLIYGCRDILSFVDVQYYNSAAMTALDGKVYTQLDVSQNYSGDFATAMTEMLLNGFPVANGQTFPALPANQVAFGVFDEDSEATEALQYLIGAQPFGGNYILQNPAGYPNMRGLMIWSINIDQQNGYALSNAAGSYLHTLPPIPAL